MPLTPRLQRALAAHVLRFKRATYPTVGSGEQATPWVFHHLTTRRHAVAGERIVSLYGAFKSAATRAGLPPSLHQHDLRHRRVTSWIAQGRDVTLVKEAMGHADLRTTMGYTHLAKEHLRALVSERETLARPSLPAQDAPPANRHGVRFRRAASLLALRGTGKRATPATPR